MTSLEERLDVAGGPGTALAGLSVGARGYPSGAVLWGTRRAPRGARRLDLIEVNSI